MAVKASASTSRRLVEQGVGDRERWQEAKDVAPGAAGERHDPLLVAVRRHRGRADRVGQRGARLAELDRHHRSAPPQVADDRVIAGDRRQPLVHQRTDLPGPAGEVVGVHLLDRTQCGGARDRVAAVGPAEPTDVDGVHQVGAPGDGRQRQPAGDALGGGHQVGDHALVVGGEPVAGAAEAGLDLVGDEHHVVARAPLRQGRQEAARGHDEPALALDRLDHDAGQVARADLLLDDVDGPGRGLLAGEPVAERVGHRCAVDLARERPEPLLVRHVLRGHRHREVGAPVVGVVEDRDRVPTGGDPGDLDGVLDRLGAGVEQRGLLGVVARRQLREGRADVDVAVVRRDHEAGVRERRHLLLDPRDHLRRRVAHAGHRDARPEIDQRVAVDVHEHAATGRGRRRPGAWCRRRPRRAASCGRAAPARRGRGSG